MPYSIVDAASPLNSLSYHAFPDACFKNSFVRFPRQVFHKDWHTLAVTTHTHWNSYRIIIHLHILLAVVLLSFAVGLLFLNLDYTVIQSHPSRPKDANDKLITYFASKIFCRPWPSNQPNPWHWAAQIASTWGVFTKGSSSCQRSAIMWNLFLMAWLFISTSCFPTLEWSDPCEGINDRRNWKNPATPSASRIKWSTIGVDLRFQSFVRG